MYNVNNAWSYFVSKLQRFKHLKVNSSEHLAELLHANDKFKFTKIMLNNKITTTSFKESSSKREQRYRMLNDWYYFFFKKQSKFYKNYILERIESDVYNKLMSTREMQYTKYKKTVKKTIKKMLEPTTDVLTVKELEGTNRLNIVTKFIEQKEDEIIKEKVATPEIIELWNKKYIGFLLDIVKKYKKINEIPESIYFQVSQDLSLTFDELTVFKKQLNNLLSYSTVCNYRHFMYNADMIEKLLEQWGISLQDEKIIQFTINRSVVSLNNLEFIVNWVMFVKRNNDTMLPIIDFFDKHPEKMFIYYNLVGNIDNYFYDKNTQNQTTIKNLVIAASKDLVWCNKVVNTGLITNESKINLIISFVNKYDKNKTIKRDIVSSFIEVEYLERFCNLKDAYTDYNNVHKNYVECMSKWYALTRYSLDLEDKVKKKGRNTPEFNAEYVSSCNLYVPFKEKAQSLKQIADIKFPLKTADSVFWTQLIKFYEFIQSIYNP